MSIIEAGKKVDMTILLKHISYIYHLVQFKKNQAKIQVTLDSDNMVNAMPLHIY